MVAGMGADPIYNRSYEEQPLAEAPAILNGCRGWSCTNHSVSPGYEPG